MSHTYDVHVEAPTGMERVTVTLPSPVRSMDDWALIRRVASATVGVPVRVISIRPVGEQSEEVAA